MDSGEISLWIDGVNKVAMYHVLYGRNKFLPMHIQYSTGWLEVRSHNRIVLEYRSLLQDDGRDASFCSVAIGETTDVAKFAFDEPRCIDVQFPSEYIVLNKETKKKQLKVLLQGIGK